jgi:hypothetical protein
LASKLRLKHVKPNDGVLERMVKPDVFWVTSLSLSIHLSVSISLCVFLTHLYSCKHLKQAVVKYLGFVVEHIIATDKDFCFPFVDDRILGWIHIPLVWRSARVFSHGGARAHELGMPSKPAEAQQPAPQMRGSSEAQHEEQEEERSLGLGRELGFRQEVRVSPQCFATVWLGLFDFAFCFSAAVSFFAFRFLLFAFLPSFPSFLHFVTFLLFFRRLITPYFALEIFVAFCLLSIRYVALI